MIGCGRFGFRDPESARLVSVPSLGALEVLEYPTMLWVVPGACREPLAVPVCGREVEKLEAVVDVHVLVVIDGADDDSRVTENNKINCGRPDPHDSDSAGR